MVTNHWLVSSLVTRLVFLQCTIQSSVGVSALWDLYTAVYTTWGGCGAQPRLEKMNRFSPRLNFTTSTKRKAQSATAARQTAGGAPGIEGFATT